MDISVGLNMAKVPPICVFLVAVVAQVAVSLATGKNAARLRREYNFGRASVIGVANASSQISPGDARARSAREALGQFRRIISMSLYGDGKDYLVGAIENAILVQRDWPTWTLRVYHDDLVPDKTLRVLRDLDVELVPRSGANADDHAGLLLRYTVLQDPTVTRYLVRDADARLSQRDKHAVDEWIESGHWFHVVRDHPGHKTEIMGGVWGAVGGFIKPAMLDEVMSSKAEIHFNEDQLYMRRFVWPHVRHHALAHDSFFCGEANLRTAAWRPFPTRRLSPHDFIGNKYEQANEYVGMDVPGFVRRLAGPRKSGCNAD